MKTIAELITDEETTVIQLHTKLCERDTTTDADVLSAARTLTLTAPRRAALFASLWASRRRAVLRKLTETLPAFTEPAVLGRAAALLDTPRRQRQQARRVEALTGAGAGPRKLRAAQQLLATLRTEVVPENFSATRSFKAVLARLLGAIDAERLEFDLLFYAEGPWKGMCDLAHPKPKAWALPYFQAVAHGGAPPEGSLCADVRTMSAATLPALLEKHPLLGASYSHVRLQLPAAARDAACNIALAEHMPLADVLWYHEELAGGAAAARVDAVIARRLEAGESLAGKMKTDNFGKLCERLLYFRQLEREARGAARGPAFWPRLMPLAEALLDELKARRLALVRGAGPRSLQELAARSLHDEGGVAALAAVPEPIAQSVPAPPSLRVAVLGDASASMQTAINSATIVGAMCAAIFDAELVFFNNKAFKSRAHPTPASAADVLAVTEEVRAGSSTSPAAALHTFYAARRPIDLFLVVTDEEENTAHTGATSWSGGSDARHGDAMFAGLFAKYRADVHPAARVSFVSFLRGANAEGQMVRDLKARGIEAAQMRMDRDRPDLSKFDAIVGSMMFAAQQQLEGRRAEAEAAAAGVAGAA